MFALFLPFGTQYAADSETRETTLVQASKTEINFLVQLIEERRAILFDKSADHDVIAKKGAAWGHSPDNTTRLRIGVHKQLSPQT